MMTKVTPYLILLSLAALGGVSTQAQDKLLPPTYQVGKTYTFEVKQDMEMDMAEVGKALGQPAMGKTTVKMIMEMVASCEAGEKAGHKSVKSKTSRVQMDMDAAGMQMKYDSNEPGSENTMLGQQMSKMVGQEFTMIMDETGEVVEMKGFEALADGPGAQMLGADQFKQMANPAMQLGIPAEGVVLGDTWKNEIDMDMGAQVGKMKVAFELKYSKDAEVDGEDCAVVEYTAKVNMDIKAQQGDAAPVQMKVEDSKMVGDMSLDKSLRFFRIGNTDMDMSMKMANPLDPNQEFKIPMNIKQTFTLKSVE